MSGTTNIPVVAIILRDGNKVLFVLRKNTGWMDGYYGLPGGHLEDGESFKQAAVRELHEEVDIEVSNDTLQHAMTSQELSIIEPVRVCLWFEAPSWEGEVKNAEPEKHERIEWLDLDELPENVIPTTRLKLEALKSGQVYFEHDRIG
jgi:8-oxo-dGTP diphosphatase